MSMVYGIIREEYNFNGKHRIAYGIAAYDRELVSPNSSVHDISSDFDAISELVADCNRLRLSPIHLKDVVIDFLSSTLK